MNKKPTLHIVANHIGGLHAARLDQTRIDKEKLFDLLQIKNIIGSTLEFIIEGSKVKHNYEIEFFEKDVS